jgi:HK97 family phage major capsid protein
MDPRAILEERQKLAADSQTIIDKAKAENRNLSEEESARFDALHKKIQELKATAERVAAQEAEAKELAHLAETRGRRTDTVVTETADGPQSDRALVLRAWALGGDLESLSGLDEGFRGRMLAACSRSRINPARRTIEARALSVGTTDAGGYSVPDEMMRAFWEIQKWFGAVRSVATIWTTGTGAPLPIPTVNDTSNVGEIVAEAGPVTTTADPTFGLVTLDSYKYSSKAVIVSVELLQDSYIDIASYLGGALGTRIGRIQNTHFSTGDNAGKPNGIATAASLGKTASATNAITFDDLIDLQHSVDPAYRGRPKAGFMMHDSIAAAARKLKDSQGRYMWEMSTQVGIPDRLLGYPVYINNDLDSALTTNKRVALFGDFQNYVIRDAGPVIFARADELRILNHQVVFLAFQRSDGDLVDTTSVRYLRTS